MWQIEEEKTWLGYWSKLGEWYVTEIKETGARYREKSGLTFFFQKQTFAFIHD